MLKEFGTVVIAGHVDGKCKRCCESQRRSGVKENGNEYASLLVVVVVESGSSMHGCRIGDFWRPMHDCMGRASVHRDASMHATPRLRGHMRRELSRVSLDGCTRRQLRFTGG